MLDATYGTNRGLLTGVGPDGVPDRSGATSDPLITESRRFYDTLQAPFAEEEPVDYPDPFTGESTPMRKTAPMTLDAWKKTFGFPAQKAGEDLQMYRDRAGVAVYYNRNELGLGRQLGCSRFTDGLDNNGAPIEGIACFVTNHGSGFRQGEVALRAAIAGTDVRNTVSITYRPTMDPGYQVQFYVYGADGRRQEWARLDTLGPRPHPQVCMTCHGGAYDDARHLAKNAHFLPLDPSIVLFAEGGSAPDGVTRAAQEERIRTFNAMALETPLTSAQRDLIAALYGGAVTTPGSAATGDGVPPAWTTSEADRDFYRGVVKPYCGTCHLAVQRRLQDADIWAYGIFSSPSAFDATPLEAYVCSTFSMPNAQPTSIGFWEAQGSSGVSLGGQWYPAPADALLARRGLTRANCSNLEAIAGCDRGEDPDALCGGAVSGGAVCDRAANRCAPMSFPPGS
jgi:hypothetical protein